MDDVIAQLKKAIENLDQLELPIAAAHVAAALDHLQTEQSCKANLTIAEHTNFAAIECLPSTDYH